eukprot:482506-Prymnesium_polylepis.1
MVGHDVGARAQLEHARCYARGNVAVRCCLALSCNAVSGTDTPNCGGYLTISHCTCELHVKRSRNTLTTVCDARETVANQPRNPRNTQRDTRETAAKQL